MSVYSRKEQLIFIFFACCALNGLALFIVCMVFCPKKGCVCQLLISVSRRKPLLSLW